MYDNTLGNTDFKTTRYQNLILNDPQFVLSYLDALREFSTNTFISNFIAVYFTVISNCYLITALLISIINQIGNLAYIST